MIKHKYINCRECSKILPKNQGILHTHSGTEFTPDYTRNLRR